MALGCGGLALVAGGGLSHVRAQEEQTAYCARGADMIANLWSPTSRQGMRAAFTQLSLPYAEVAFGSASELIDEYSRAWAEGHEQACRATHLHGEQSEALLELRMGCLEERFDALEGLLTVFGEADAALVEASLSSVHGLPPLARCSDTPALLAQPPLPKDQVARAEIRDVRGELARLKVL